MLLGRSVRVVLVAVLLVFPVLAGCGGSDDPIASRTAADDGDPSTSGSGGPAPSEAGSASSTGAESTRSAPGVGSTSPAASTAADGDHPATSAVSEGSAGDVDQTTGPNEPGQPTTIEVSATTAGVVATGAPPSNGASATSSATTALTGSSTVTTATGPPTSTGSTTATTRRLTTRATTTTTTTTTTTAGPNAVLLFTRTTGYRHPSISDGVVALSDLARSAGHTVEVSADPTLFSDGELARFAAVVFLSTSGDVLNAGQQSAFERYIEGGGGFVGVHAATDTEYDWPWYGRLVGTWFADHPLLANEDFVDCHCSTASVVRQASHPSTDHLPSTWRHRDEWYNFRSPLPASARILLTVDESTYSGGTMGSVHPVTWTQRIGDGRSWYTALGHTPASYRDPDFRRHLLGGLEWAAGR